jgi:hypothetical protein
MKNEHNYHKCHIQGRSIRCVLVSRLFHGRLPQMALPFSERVEEIEKERRLEFTLPPLQNLLFLLMKEWGEKDLPLLMLMMKGWGEKDLPLLMLWLEEWGEKDLPLLVLMMEEWRKKDPPSVVEGMGEEGADTSDADDGGVQRL